MGKSRWGAFLTLLVLLLQATPWVAHAATSEVTISNVQASYVEGNGLTTAIEVIWTISSGNFAPGDQIQVEKRADQGSWVLVGTTSPSATSYRVLASEFESERLYDLSVSVEHDGVAGVRNVAVVTGKPSVQALGQSGCIQLSDLTKACDTGDGHLEVSNSSEVDDVKGECFLTQGKAVCPRKFNTGGADFREIIFSGDLLYVQSATEAPLLNVVELSYGCARTSASKIYCWGPGWEFARSLGWKTAADIKWPTAVSKFTSYGRTVCGLSAGGVLTCRAYDGTTFNGTPNSTLRTKSGQPSSCIESVMAAQICLGSIPNDPQLMDWLGLNALTAAPSSFAQVTAGAPPVNTWEKGKPPCYLASQSGKFACWKDNEIILKSTIGGFVRLSADGKLAQTTNSEVYRSVQVGNYLRMTPLYSSSRILVNLPLADLPKYVAAGTPMVGEQYTIATTPQPGENYSLTWYVDGEEVSTDPESIQLPSNSWGKDFFCIIKGSAAGKATRYTRVNLGQVRANPVLTRAVSGQPTLGSTLTATISLASGSLTRTVWQIDGQVFAQDTSTAVAPYDASGKRVDVIFYVRLGNETLNFESNFQLDTWEVPTISATGQLLQGTEIATSVSGAPYSYTLSWFYFDHLTKEYVLIPGETSSSLFLRDYDFFIKEENFTVRYTFQIPGKNPVELFYTWEGSLEKQVLQTDTPAIVPGGHLEPGGSLDCTHQVVAGATYEYLWTRNDNTISGATSKRFTISNSDVGNQIRCVVFGSKQWHSLYSAGSTYIVPAAAPEATKIIWGSAFLKNYAPNAKVKLTATIQDFGSGFPSEVTYRTKLGTGAWSKQLSIAVPTHSFAIDAVLSKNLLVEVTFADSRGRRTYSQVVHVAPTITAQCTKTVNKKLKLVCAILNPKIVRGVKQGGTLVVDVKTSTWYKGSCGAVARTSNAYTGFGINVGSYTAIGLKETNLVNGRARVEIPVKFNGEFTWVVSCSMPGYATVMYDDVFKQTTN